jgi:hypothetical protein
VHDPTSNCFPYFPRHRLKPLKEDDIHVAFAAAIGSIQLNVAALHCGVPDLQSTDRVVTN